jgi:hypothetical protein
MPIHINYYAKTGYRDNGKFIGEKCLLNGCDFHIKNFE